jgi:hypothetical protein
LMNMSDHHCFDSIFGPQWTTNVSNSRGLPHRLYWVNRWLYRGGRPRLIVRSLNRFAARQFAAGLKSRPCDMTLELHGRRTGRVIALPVVVADYDGGRYLVSMLGENANWVSNVRAAEGRVVLRRRASQHVQLEEVPTPDRAPILRRYLEVAPGARPHFPVDLRSPLTEYERIASLYPVFRIIDDRSQTLP